MVATIVGSGLRILLWGLAVVGIATLLLGGLVAWPVTQPPELQSISEARKSLDFSQLPSMTRFQARDGTTLAYRHYPASGVASGKIAIVVHGSSGSSRGASYMLCNALAARGVEVYAPDIRGHGESGTRGDIAYPGQLDDDFVDLVGEIRRERPNAPLTLIGHSAGGGFALRIAGSPIQNLVARTVLLAPYLGYDAPSTRGQSAGGWASPDIPRLLALLVLHKLGLPWAESLPTLAFAVPPNSTKMLTSAYSFRLMRAFAASTDFRKDLAMATHPIAIFAGSADELMWSDKYREAVGDRATVKIIDGINHMGIVGNPAAVAVIADDVARSDAGS
jgi:alpha-beta hydrolase superfamily lysophospholipase